MTKTATVRHIYQVKRERVPSPIQQSEELAASLAHLAHRMRIMTLEAFEKGLASHTLQSLYVSFQSVFLSNLTQEQFADIFAQTLAYGFVAARSGFTNSAPLSSLEAIKIIARTTPFLRKLFDPIINSKRENEPFITALDELAQLSVQTIRETAMQSSTSFINATEHFYENFLKQYDPQLRKMCGVYYTPEPVVSYIVRSLDHLLRCKFGHQNGLAGTSLEDYQCSPPLLLLDPSCGTGIFLSSAIEHIRKLYQRAGKTGAWRAYLRNHLLPGFFGFELLPAPYVIAHLKLGMQLAALDLPEAERREWAHDFESNEQLRISLGNTLEEAETYLARPDSRLMRTGMPRSCQEPLIVIFGNPPYSGHSLNKGKWITDLIETYKEDCPELKKPGQAKWLSDDYVKFIRFAQWHIEQAGRGIIAFVTNHSYLDNPTFRGMRRSLMQSFDEIYILDLHGNNKKKEHAPDGSKDENVFDIQQGVAISIYVKWSSSPKSSQNATVWHADVWGLREAYETGRTEEQALTGGKYSWLAQHDIANTPWTELKLQAPFFLFAPQTQQYISEYESGWAIPAIFRLNGDPAPGIITTQDEFAISWTKDEALQKVESLLATHSEAEARQLFQLCTQEQWQYEVAKSELANGHWRQEALEVLYRPFDKRWTIFNRQVAVHLRKRVMRHMLAGPNTGIVLGRAGQVIDQQEWDIVFCTSSITEYNLYRRGGNNLFPLYLYSGQERSRRANIAPEFITAFSSVLEMHWICDGKGNLQDTFGPEDVFAYMYAVFYSPAYRKRYAPFLKIDFPRLPLTSQTALFQALCDLGESLLDLHLMERQVPLITCYPVRGGNAVEKVYYEGTNAGRVWMNKTQYIEGVPASAWNFHIGGYQVCQKWLKDRKGQRLTREDLRQYQEIVAVLVETVRLMSEIDEVIERYGGWPIV